MGYRDQKGLEDAELYLGFNNKDDKKGVKRVKRTFKSKSKPPVIKFTVNDSPELSPEEKLTIDEICADSGVFFKPRKSKTAIFKSKEPWHFIFPDLHSYQGWLYSNRLTNAMYSGWDFDVFDLTESGEGIL